MILSLKLVSWRGKFSKGQIKKQKITETKAGSGVKAYIKTIQCRQWVKHADTIRSVCSSMQAMIPFLPFHQSDYHFIFTGAITLSSCIHSTMKNYVCGLAYNAFVIVMDSVLVWSWSIPDFFRTKFLTCGCSTVVHVLLNGNSKLPLAFMQHHSSLKSQWNLKHIPHETAVNPFTVLFLAVFYCQCRQNRWCHKEQAFMAIVPLVLWTFLVLLKVW